MTSIRGLLRHRATVRRAQDGYVDGLPLTEWVVVDEDLRCLLDALGSTPPEGEPLDAVDRANPYAQRRTGTLFTHATADLRPGDRVTVKYPKELVGHFKVEGTPATVSTLHGVSHKEFRVSEVPGPQR